jgi:hypothetical protein
MLERVVYPWHLGKLDRSVEISRQPELLEVRDVAEVPEYGTHQRIVLAMEILVGKAFHQQQCALPRFGQAAGDQGSWIIRCERNGAHGDG